ncbi:MAG TPA: glycosyltransferase [Bryobacteraceae bacterium]|jgi:glycosyltransferase involved in cell wall biosynthesis|nr:glycosyltransferase [Bryobacteraceae bacterium]
MTKPAAVTWLMPVRNGMPYLSLTLESIAKQSYQNHKMLVWDNGSKDGTLEELRRWIPARIPGAVVSGKPMGVGASRAALLDMAESELCAWTDADDVSYPERLEVQVPFLLGHPELAALGTQVDIIDEHGVRRGQWTYKTDDAEARWLTRWHAQLCQSAVLCRRSALLAAGNYRDVRDEDLDLWMRLAAVGEIRNLPETLVQYRRTQTSTTGKIEDFYTSDRAVAARNAAILFPTIGDPHRAMELWEAAHPRQPEATSRVQHIWQLKRAATLLAKALGKPAGYFVNTQAFRDQLYALKTRAYRRFGLAPLVALKARVMHAGS